MKITFLGGADEVGASCTLLEVAGKRFLIDAGIRMGAKEGDQLPHLAQIQEGGPLDAILLTHAHTDHIGALPLVHIAYPEIPIVTTPPTRRLTQILLADALRIMESRWQREKELPLYPEHTVTAMLARMQVVDPGQDVLLPGHQVAATFTLSGHVLGACSIMLDTPDGRVFFTGDYSLDPQRTVEGMTVPKGRPSLVISESTYGNRLHANRKSEEERLVQSVAGVVAAGGKVLIPAFALGRAQEAILLLLQAQRKGRIPPFPIYVDGMVKTVCSAYACFPDYLSRDLRRLIQAVGNPFFHEGAFTVPVQADQRQAIADSQEPCCIISSSGMLTGGPSQFYAAALAPNPKNAIFITGYQDEESPGRRVLDLADGKTRQIRFGAQETTVACQVGRYSLSAHADSAQMLGVLQKLSPQDVYLVHGDSSARATLATSASDRMQVHLPKNGETFEHCYKSKGHKRLNVKEHGFGQGAPFCAETLRKYLLISAPAHQSYSCFDLAQAWFGAACGPEELEQVRSQLSLTSTGYTPDPHHPHLYRLTPHSGTTLSKKERQEMQNAGRLEQNLAFQVVDRIFAGHDDLYKKGLSLAKGELVLSFHFPALAAQRYASKLDELAVKTGWKVKLTEGVHQEALIAHVQRLLPAGWSLPKAPSIHLSERRVVAKVQRTPQGPAFADLEAQYFQRTGHRLQLQDSSLAPQGSSGPAAEGRWELNQAYGRIRQAFQEHQVTVFRCGRKEDLSKSQSWIELALVSPQLAQRHQALRSRLEQETGWPIRFAQEPNQDFIKRRTRELIPSAWGLRKEPGFFKSEGLVQVSLAERPALDDLESLSKQLELETGYRVQLAPG